MKTPACLLILGLAVALTNLGAETTREATPPTREEVEAYVKEMTSYIAGREERVARIVNQIVELDGTLKSTVGGVLTKLKTITDSRDSKTKVTRIKRDVIEQIRKAADAYVAERARLDEALKVTGNPYRREDLYKERKDFDGKIDNMVNAMVDLALSMDTHKDYERYVYEHGSAFGGRDTTVRRNPQYDQNRRTTTQAGAARKEVSETLKQSLDRLKAKQEELDQQLAGKKLGEEQKKTLQAELDRVTDMRNERIQQLYTLTSPAQKPTVAIGLHDAMQLEDVIELAATSARRDMANLFARYRELRAERDAIADQQVRLARAEKWLKENEAAKEH